MQLPEYRCPGPWGGSRRSSAVVPLVLLLLLAALCSARAAASQQPPEDGADQDSTAQQEALPPGDRRLLGRSLQSRRHDNTGVQAPHVPRTARFSDEGHGDRRRLGSHRKSPRSHRRRANPYRTQRPSPYRTRRPSPYRTRRPSPYRRRRPSPYRRRPSRKHRRPGTSGSEPNGPRRPRPHDVDDTTEPGVSDGAQGGFQAGRRGRRRQHVLQHPTPQEDGGHGRYPRHSDDARELKMCNMTSPFGSPRCNRRCIQSRAWPCGRTSKACATSSRATSSPSARRKGKMADRKCRGKRLLQRQQHDLLYGDWSGWGSCTRSCKQRRRRRCLKHEVCQNSFILETRRCGARGTRCHKRFKAGKKRPAVRPTSDTDLWGKADNGQQGSESGQRRKPAETTTVATTAHDDGGGGGGGASGGDNNNKDKADNKSNEPQDEEEPHDKGLAGKGDDSEEQEDGEDVLSAMRDTCGIRPPATRGSYRVVGGQEAQPFSWPWQVAILTRWEEQYCAGALVAPQWVLTAAHCVRKNNRRRRIVVRAGEHNLEEYEGTEDDVKPAKEFPHPDFDYATITNDIALVRLSRPLRPRTQAVSGLACVPDDGFQADPDSLCYILGWGKRRNTHLFGAEALHEAKVPQVAHKRCQQAFEYEINNATQLCAGYKRGGRDACAGDSGGPLLCPRTDDTGVTRWFLVGVTSYGEGCGRKGKYGIYTNVVNFRRWMEDTIRSN